MSKILLFTLLYFYAFTLLAPLALGADQYTLFLKSSSTTLSPSPTKVDIYIHPSQAISTLAFKLLLPTSVEVTDSTGHSVAQITENSDFMAQGSWIIPFKKVVRTATPHTIEFAAVTLSKTGFVAQSDALLASFYLTSKSSSSPLQLTFDPKLSNLMTRATPLTDIASFPTPALTFTTTSPGFFARLTSFFTNMLKWRL